MRIAVIAPIRHPIAEPFRGRMETHCHQLCAGLRERGHDVTLFAAACSSDPQFQPICDTATESVLPQSVWRGSGRLAEFHRVAFTKAWDAILSGDFDVVHNNSLFPHIAAWAARDGIACVTSQHVPPFGTMREVTERHMTDPGIVVTVPSRAQLANWSEAVRMRIAVVPDGICCETWQPVGEPDDYFVWSGRIAPRDGTTHAVRAARIAGAKLRIVGPVEDAAYFVREIEPLLGAGVEYHGHLNSHDLAGVVARARAAIVTPLSDEPFPLAAAQALASGSPVFAFDCGALAEVVGDCGIVVPVGDVMMLASVMTQADRFSRAACRERAQFNFGLMAMIEGYETCYEVATASLTGPGWPR